MNVALETGRREGDIYIWVFYILLLCKTLDIYIARDTFPDWQPVNPEDVLGGVVPLSPGDALQPGTPVYGGLRGEERKVRSDLVPVQALPPTSSVTLAILFSLSEPQFPRV